jgi:hypothetical protein
VPTLATIDGPSMIGRGPLGHVGQSMAGSLGLFLDDDNRCRASIAHEMIVLWHGHWKAITLSWSIVLLLSLARRTMFAAETQMVTISCDP